MGVVVLAGVASVRGGPRPPGPACPPQPALILGVQAPHPPEAAGRARGNGSWSPGLRRGLRAMGGWREPPPQATPPSPPLPGCRAATQGWWARSHPSWGDPKHEPPTFIPGPSLGLCPPTAAPQPRWCHGTPDPRSGGSADPPTAPTQRGSWDLPRSPVMAAMRTLPHPSEHRGTRNPPRQ